MIKHLRILVPAMALCITAWSGEAQTLTLEQRAEIAKRLKETQELLFGSLAGLSAKQLAFKPAADRWSIAEVAEHLVLMEGGTLPLLKQLLAAPGVSGEPALADEVIGRAVRNRTRRISSPEALAPTGRFTSVEQITATFSKLRSGVARYVETTEEDLRGHRYPHPALGPMDGYQWLLFVNAHLERHVQQIEEVKRTPGFPAE